jgi:hypothetical protein
MENIIGADFEFDEATSATAVVEDGDSGVSEIDDAPVVKFCKRCLGRFSVCGRLICTLSRLNTLTESARVDGES